MKLDRGGAGVVVEGAGVCVRLDLREGVDEADFLVHKGGVADERPAHPSEKEAHRQSREMPLRGGARRSYPPRLRRGCEWREGPYRRFKHVAQKWRPCDERALRSARTPARTTRKINLILRDSARKCRLSAARGAKSGTREAKMIR